MAKRTERRGDPLYIIGACGLAGVAIDVDHVLYCLWHRLPLTWDNLTSTGRPLHIPVLLVSSALCFVAGALLARRSFVR